MSITGYHFVILLTVSIVSMVSSWCTRSITCPCGPTRREIYYTHCLNGTLEKEITCERWANCKTCEANVAHCLACLPGRSGPTCEEVKREPKSCLDPGIPEGGSRQSEDGSDDMYPHLFRVGESAYFTCKEEDSDLEGPSVITCMSTGTWSDSLPRCQKPDNSSKSSALGKFCKYPGVNANSIIENPEYSDSLDDGQMFPSTTRLKYKCKEGYKLEGQSALFCLCSGEWTADPPTCVPNVPDPSSSLIHCEGRGPISNGRVIEYRDLDQQLPSYTEYGPLYPARTRLHYSCNQGYILQGSRIVVCESSGLWSAKEPNCIEDTILRQTPAPNDDSLSKVTNVPNDDDGKNSVSEDDNLIRNVISNSKTIKSKEHAGKSNSLIFKFFFF